MSIFSTRVNASADAIRAGFEDNDLDAMGSQDGGCTKSGNAGTDYDDFLLGWLFFHQCLPLLLILVQDFLKHIRAFRV